MRSLSERSSVRDNSRTRECWNCSELTDHFANTCPKPRMDRGSRDKRCSTLFSRRRSRSRSRDKEQPRRDQGTRDRRSSLLFIRSKSREWEDDILTTVYQDRGPGWAYYTVSQRFGDPQCMKVWSSGEIIWKNKGTGGFMAGLADSVREELLEDRCAAKLFGDRGRAREVDLGF